MALGNLRAEPRREITESLVGTGVIATLIFLDCWVSSWFNNRFALQDSFERGVTYVWVPIAFLFVFILGVYFPHHIGDAICDGLDKFGLRLRPQQRYAMQKVWKGHEIGYVRERVKVNG